MEIEEGVFRQGHRPKASVENTLGYPSVIIATPFKFRIPFKAKALGPNLLQPNGDWVCLNFHY